jgi:hypothetical protein
MLLLRGTDRRLRAIHRHGVISAGALTPVLVCVHKLEITPLSNFPPPRRHRFLQGEPAGQCADHSAQFGANYSLKRHSATNLLKHSRKRRLQRSQLRKVGHRQLVEQILGLCRQCEFDAAAILHGGCFL